MWAIVIILVVVFLLKSVMASNNAGRTTQVGKTVSNTPTAGDCFNQGCAIVAGVPESPVPKPPQSPARSRYPIHCCHVLAGGGLPIHVAFPVAPPPIAIQAPKVVLPSPIIRRPINYLSASGLQIPVRQTLTCGTTVITSGGLRPRRVQSGKAGCQGCFLGVRCL